MGALTLKVARFFAVGMIFAIIALTGIAVVEGVAHAATGGTAVAKLTAALLARGGNDAATQIYSAAPNPQVRAEMRNGAHFYCQGDVYEDFSCATHREPGMVQAEDGSWVPADYYSKTDYRPVKAAVGH